MIDARERFQAAADLFLAARSVPADQLNAFLEQACGGDAALLREVRTLLENAQATEAFETLAGRLRPAVNRLREGVSETTLGSSGLDITAGGEADLSGHVESRIGNYELQERIGEGGFGQVWVAEQREPFQRRVAIKVIKPGMDSREVLARFDMERQALALMDHAHIAKVFDAGMTERGRPYFVMEYVPGLSITEYCDQVCLRTRDRLKLFAEVCSAVQHAHVRGVIHRDLKPSNVLVSLVDGQPSPKVIDFGIAKATAARLSKHTLFTELGRMIGTPAYMSPEQAGSAGVDIDTRSDVYSLGVILYQLLTGTTPFDQKMLRKADHDAVVRIIREWEPPRPSTRVSALLSSGSAGDSGSVQIAKRQGTDAFSLKRTLSGELDWIVMKCLEKDRARRYESVADLAADVRRYLAGEPVVAAPPGAGYRLRKFVRRHRIIFFAASAVLTALILGLGVSTFLFLQERDARRRAVAAEATQTKLRQLADDARQSEAAQRAAAENERDRARMEAAKVEKINAFLQNMLSAIDPNRAKGREVTMREALDDAAARIETDPLRDEPEVNSAIRSTIGTTYTKLARFAEAEKQLNAALEARRAHFDEPHALVAQSLLELGSLRYVQGDYSAAEALYRRALMMLRELLPEEHNDVAVAKHLLAESCSELGKLDEAESLFAEVLSARRAGDRPDDMGTVDTLNEWGEIRNSRGDYGGAEKLWREALETGLRISGEDHQAVATCYNNLATSRYLRGDFSGAIDNNAHALKIRRKLFGPDHPDIAHSLRNLATSYFAAGDLRESEVRYREALEIQRRALDPGHTLIATTLEGLAATLRLLGVLDQAETLQREALGIRARALPPEHPLVAQAEFFLGLVLIDQKNYAEAEETLRRSLAARRKALASEDLVVAENIVCLGRVRRLLGEPQEAEQLTREALALVRRLGGDNHPRAASTLNELGLIREQQGDLAEAEAAYREALAILRGRDMQAHRDAASVMHNLGVLLGRRGERAGAETLLRDALQIREESLSADHPLAAATRDALGALISESGDR